MPKDLTKLSLKEFEAMSNGDVDNRFRWHSGTLELTVSQDRPRHPYEDPDADA